MPDNSFFLSYGLRKLIAKMNARESVAPVFQEACDAWADTMPPGEMAAGFAAAGILIIEDMKRMSGVVFDGPYSLFAGDYGDTRMAFERAIRRVHTDPTELGRLFGLMAGAIDTVVAKTPGKWSIRSPQSAASDAQKTAEVQKIEIIGMPERRTATEIARDTMGNIVSSTQTESDLQP